MKDNHDYVELKQHGPKKRELFTKLYMHHQLRDPDVLSTCPDSNCFDKKSGGSKMAKRTVSVIRTFQLGMLKAYRSTACVPL
ncbi:hypothetical protein QJS04_geneDACA013840 [Acorus gramineus]|uniref:Uncharacterized protein n=1 Tax=Acorus gramineus TaxID=55184 RepID=A0AAV9B052_ACOGR|nr:hypothetical protein QJS04_geneDACA013840 [Acorus gramineus]